MSLLQRILAVLPQTQCTRCGYPDCAAYAQAIAQSEANINQCPPGGAVVIANGYAVEIVDGDVILERDLIRDMARSADLIADLDADMTAGTLPAVSWIVGPANVSEHATWWPSAGEDFTARIAEMRAAIDE